MTWDFLSGVAGIICALTVILGSEYRENGNKRPTRFFCRGQQAKAAEIKPGLPRTEYQA
ncbi:MULTISPECIES: hypothetical protein [Pseudomonas]|uniref:hypothetical protein n=1 Tax=Pseudomonas TaxID=286 RepID=UPI000F6F6D62|nr:MULTISPECIES: hypothetical protein [Pseudomonas]AZE04803.1 hypothetical protein C4K11_2641 [Pseudomonas chlororaphis subsp. aureofaciens]WJV27792.1 hypothetical protein PSR66_12635 [Pseudomonas chlororaphis]